MATPDARPTLAPDDPRHGTPNGYGNLKCRCQKCRDAHAAKCLERRQARVKRGLADDDARHGTPNAYGNWGCRCPRCTKAWAERSAKSKSDDTQPAEVQLAA